MSGNFLVNAYEILLPCSESSETEFYRNFAPENLFSKKTPVEVILCMESITRIGLSSACLTVPRPDVEVFVGKQDGTEMTVRPPAITSTFSGQSAVAVWLLPQSNPG